MAPEGGTVAGRLRPARVRRSEPEETAQEWEPMAPVELAVFDTFTK
ncbi:hypothetical protein MMF93_18400 [Streptomyces tubbatahanensis]|uniref:Uncharacterized protein n=1 Tax=Streptomyces tubbatahanensis TaxID=2923272 RepID=A0ABY3XUN8_9ACTN|nr:hypothetical protein [Streptomyces tubbatahanensis]UNS98203.1 hypothetical protein MMF93_18400 [Streptomyces tubbatahanensis]